MQTTAMTTLAKAMEVAFILSWCVGVAAHLYATRYWLPMWANGFKKSEKHRGYMRKAIIGYGIFILAVGFGLGAGEVAEYWGGGW